MVAFLGVMKWFDCAKIWLADRWYCANFWLIVGTRQCLSISHMVRHVLGLTMDYFCSTGST